MASSAATKLEQAAGALTGEAKSYGELYVKVLKRGLEKVGGGLCRFQFQRY